MRVSATFASLNWGHSLLAALLMSTAVLADDGTAAQVARQAETDFQTRNVAPPALLSLTTVSKDVAATLLNERADTTTPTTSITPPTPPSGVPSPPAGPLADAAAANGTAPPAPPLAGPMATDAAANGTAPAAAAPPSPPAAAAAANGTAPAPPAAPAVAAAANGTAPAPPAPPAAPAAGNTTAPAAGKGKGNAAGNGKKMRSRGVMANLKW